MQGIMHLCGVEISTSYLNTQTPLGWIEMQAGLEGLTSLKFVDYPGIDQGSNYYFELAERQIRDYFGGKRTVFDLPIAPQGSAFDQKVWQQIQKVAFGETSSYSRIARLVGISTGARAAGSATGRNPILLLVPCHRIVGEDKSLSGYSGGLDRKKWLLDWETRDSRPRLFRTQPLNNGMFRS